MGLYDCGFKSLPQPVEECDAAAVAAAVSSDAPEVSHNKQVVTCVGSNGWQ